MMYIVIWAILGLIGFILYCLNEMPKKSLLIFPFMTHILFGPLGLFYGYVCFTCGNRSKEKE